MSRNRRQQLGIVIAFGAAATLIGAAIVASQWSSAGGSRASPSTEAIATPSPPAPAIPPHLNIYFLGDSITAGYFASDVGHSYRADLLSMLEQAGHQVTPALAADSQAAYRGKVATAASQYQPASDADVLVVELGTNDYSGFGAPSPTTLADFSKDYAGILDAARRASGSVRFVCISLWQPTAQPNASGIQAGAYDQVIQTLCEARKGLFVTVQRFYLDQADHSSPGQLSSFGAPDAFHPGDTGHLAIAAAIYDILPRLWARL